jgi:hypothetical protein
MLLRGCSPVGSTQVNFGPKSLKTELWNHWITSPDDSADHTHPNRPRVSAAIKGMPFACVQSLISSCLL